MMGLYAKLANLPLEISEYEIETIEQVVPSGWSRKTSLIHLRGGGGEGVGEDVIWNDEDHRVLAEEGTDFPLVGTDTLAGFSRRLDAIELFPRPQSRNDCGLYRRWRCTRRKARPIPGNPRPSTHFAGRQPSTRSAYSSTARPIRRLRVLGFTPSGTG